VDTEDINPFIALLTDAPGNGAAMATIVPEPGGALAMLLAGLMLVRRMR
jgi:hypothetical protein